jgi:hypothetical protein
VERKPRENKDAELNAKAARRVSGNADSLFSGMNTVNIRGPYFRWNSAPISAETSSKMACNSLTVEPEHGLT